MKSFVSFGGRLLGASLLAIIVLQAAPAEAVEEFHAFLAPDSTLVHEDSTFVVSFAVDSTAHHFNAYEVVIQFDPAKVSFISAAAGPRMLAACSNQFTFPARTESTITFSDALLCAGAVVDGPGVIGLFTFKRVGHGQTPLVITSDPNRTFYDAGIYVSPSSPTYPRQVIFTKPGIVVFDPETSVPAPPAASTGLGLDYRPNPAASGGRFAISVPGAGALRLAVFDAAGRRVFEHAEAADAPGEREVRWGGADPDGRPLPGGVYFARLEWEHETRTTKVVIAR